MSGRDRSRGDAFDAPTEQPAQVYRRVLAGGVSPCELLDLGVLAAKARGTFLVAIEAQHHVSPLPIAILQQPIGSKGGQHTLAQREKLLPTLDEGGCMRGVLHLPDGTDCMAWWPVPRTLDGKEGSIYVGPCCLRSRLGDEATDLGHAVGILQ